MSYGASCQGFLTVRLIGIRVKQKGRSQTQELNKVLWKITKGTCHILSSKYF